MKRIVFFAVLVFALQVSLAQAQVNNWSFYRTVGDRSATTSSQILSDSAKEGTKCQSFTTNLPANTFVEWRKPLDKTYITPAALYFWYKLRNFNAPINQAFRLQFFFQKGDSLRETKVIQASHLTVGYWFEIYSKTDTLIKLSSFDAIILRFYFDPQNGGVGEFVFDNLRMAYGVFGRIDSTITLDRFGDTIGSRFSVLKKDFNFDSVDIGRSKTDSLFVKNTGDYKLLISSVTVTNPAFSIDPNKDVFPPGDSTMFRITFQPTVQGKQNGCVIMNHNAVSSPDTINVLGFGRQKTDVFEKKAQESHWFSLHQNYPNPWNASTIISFELARTSFTTLRIYSALGREISTLISKTMTSGQYEIRFAANDLPSGLYFYRLQSGSSNDAKKLLLLR